MSTAVTEPTVMGSVTRPVLDELDVPLGKRVRLRRLLYGRGLKNGTLLILPIDQGLEHGPIDFFPNPPSQDPDYQWRLALEGNYNAVACHYGLARKYMAKYAGEVPLLLKVNGKMYATKFITSSDGRLKENIQPLSGALSAVLQLQGKTYRLLEQPSGTNDIGLIAQDVEKILPEIVSETEDGYKAIAYQSLTAVLIEAMKEQQQQITALQQENQLLKSIMAEQMDALLARVTMLEGIKVAQQ